MATEVEMILRLLLPAGVGFLGAGAIIRGGESIVAGLTTAATVWAIAGIGLAAGAGLYLVSAVATTLILIVLLVPRSIGVIRDYKFLNYSLEKGNCSDFSRENPCRTY